MKLILYAIILTALSVLVHAGDTTNCPKIGLVLSGGGAKGFAHIGALRVIEEAGIPVSCITGTSIGSIVGGLYAIGYDAETLEKIIGNQNWESLLSNEPKRAFIPAVTKEEQSRYLLSLPVKSNKIAIPEGVLNGQKIMDLLTYLSCPYHNTGNFSEFPIPFRCIAADIATGEEVVLDKGYLPMAMRASMSVPAVFAPCMIERRLLVDGGIINNFPVDRCREMGADIIIGIDIGDERLTREQIQSLPDMINQLTILMGFDRNLKNRNDVDILIKPDISGYTSSSFNTEAAIVLMKRGEEAARKALPALIRLRDSLGLPQPEKKPLSLPDNNALFYVSRIDVEGTEKSNIVSILSKMGIGKDKRTSLHDIREGIARIYATGNYRNIDYRISGNDRKAVTIMVRESSTNKLNIGLNYNSDIKAAALINMTLYSNRISGSNLSADAKLSTSPVFALRYYLDRGAKPGFLTSASFIADELWGYRDGEKTSEINVQQTSVQAGSHLIAGDNFRVAFGASLEYFHFGTVIGDVDSSVIRDNTFMNYFVKAGLDVLDNPNFPETGWTMNGVFKLITDNGWNYQDQTPSAILGLSAKFVRRISGRVVIIPSFDTQLSLFSDAPVFYRSYIGGSQATNYFGNYHPFNGLRRMQISSDNVFLASLELRIRMWQKIYTTLTTGGGAYNDLYSINEGTKYLLGGSMALAYDSVVGPVELILSTSNLNRKIIPYFSLGFKF